MLHLIKCPENGDKQYLLVRSRASNNARLSPSLTLIGAFSRDEVISLGQAITETLTAEAEANA